MALAGSGQGQRAGPCEHSNELRVPTSVGNFLSTAEFTGF